MKGWIMEESIDICLLLGVFFFALKYLRLACQSFSEANRGVSYFEAGCTFLVMSMLCASFFPIRQHVANSTANALAREKAEEEGIIIEPGTGTEIGEPRLIDSTFTCLILAFLAFCIRRITEITPIFYGILVWPAVPFFLYHLFIWGCR